MEKDMEKDIFISKMNEKGSKLNIMFHEKQLNNFYKFMNLLIEWNERVNLTAITEPDEIVIKHFIDSLTILKFIPEEANIIDVGTGGGFPGIPLKIVNENQRMVLLDSLNKRINFLNEVIKELQLQKIETLHARVEETGKQKMHREKYDIATSRAVANLPVLLEYMLPLVKIGGKAICMKGSNIEEVKSSNKALEYLGGEIEKIEEITLPDTDIKRNIIIVKKIKETPKQYPRKPGTPSKQPI